LSTDDRIAYEIGMETRVKINPKDSPRERILSAASQLFYRHGIHMVGVDEIAAAAGSNKMTLYRGFGSKERLIVEWLRATSAAAQEKWREVEDAHPHDALARLHGLVDMMVSQISVWMRGCPFGNSMAELSDLDHPAHDVIREYYHYQRDWLERACREAQLREPDHIADAMFFIIRGTSTGLALDDAAEFAKRERRALSAVIDAARGDV
jgi:AcrR family transcriptional regulator